MINKPREIALKTLYKINQEQAYSNLALDEELKQNRKILNEKDIGLISEITYGVTTWKLTLDTIIKKHSKIKLKKISPWIINILRMGIYQIIFLDKIPKSAAVNESVNLAKRYGHTSSSNFVNAILRKVEKEDYEELFQIKNNVERISKTTSTPEWIVKKLIEDNGLEKTKEICENSNLHPKVTIRINKLKNTKQELENSLKEKNIELLVTYEPKMRYMIEWWKQLYGESEGKEEKGIFPAGAEFTTDLHSLGQYVQEGRRNLFETVINIKNSDSDLKINHDEDDLDCLNYLENKSLDYINKKAMEGTIQAHVDGDVPNIIVNMERLDAETLGQLIYFFELACAMSGKILGVDPFNQPGVEKYKTNMFKLLGKPGYEK